MINIAVPHLGQTGHPPAGGNVVCILYWALALLLRCRRERNRSLSHRRLGKASAGDRAIVSPC